MDSFYTRRVHGFAHDNTSLMRWDKELSNLEGGTDGGAHSGEGQEALSLVVVLASSLSLVSLVFAFITYSLFSDLRTLAGTALMNLLSALFLEQLLSVVGVGGIQDGDLCVALALALHYVRLAVFAWFLVIAIDLHATFRENISLLPVTQPRLQAIFCRLSLLGWGSPLPFVTVASLLHVSSKDRITNCWFLPPATITVWALAIPCAIYVVISAIYWVKTAKVITCTSAMQIDRRMQQKMRRKRRLQLVVFVKLTVLVASVTASGIAACLLAPHAKYGLWAAYGVANSLQGVVVALSVTCNCKVLRLYTRHLRHRGPRQNQRRRSYSSLGSDADQRPVLMTPSSDGPAGGNNNGTPQMTKSASLQMITWDPTPEAV